VNRILKTSIVGIALCMCSDVIAEDTTVLCYIPDSVMPKAQTWLPGPPDSTSMAFAYDMHCYEWYKTLRNDEERAIEAIKDSVEVIPEVLKRFEEAFGMELSLEETPEIYTLIEGAMSASNKVCDIPKAHWFRTRPFVFFNEHTLTPLSEARLSQNGSYPSGHTCKGFITAMLLTEINPQRADKLFERGYQIGISRLIVGMHWRSDVNDARMIAAEVVALLHSNTDFLKQMEKAKAEFQAKKATGISSVSSDVNNANNGNNTKYTLSGMKADNNYKGVLLRTGKNTYKDF